MLNAYFVSDLHLTSSTDARAALFLRFLADLERKSDVSHLFLMGDIFDVWVGDHQYYIDRYQAIVIAICRLKDQGVQIHYFEGNHDLYLNRFWGKKLGLIIHKGPAVFDLGHRRVRVEHGDQMDPNDTGYLFLRWFLRTPLIRFLNNHLPGSLIARVGERASKASRAHNTEKNAIPDSGVVAITRKHAKKARLKTAFDLILSGHVHVRDDYEFDHEKHRVRSVNLGTWLDSPCYFRIHKSGDELILLGEMGAK